MNVEAGTAEPPLEERIAILLGSGFDERQIVDVAVEPSPFASRFPADVLTVNFADHSQLALFVKKFGPEEADHPDKQRRDREILVYEELLGAPDLPTARLYGVQHNDASGRTEAYLEFVPDWDLRYQDLNVWYTAAGRLADLHAHFHERRDELARCDFLLTFDATYFTAWAERALEVVSVQSQRLTGRVRAIIDDYERVVSVLAAQPVTLVHNDLGPKNVMADRSQRRASIAFVDWEMAGVGCGLFDLATLKYGLSTEHDARMLAAYFARAEQVGLVYGGDRWRALAACDVHRTMLRLWRNQVWQLPDDSIEEWVAEAEREMERL